MPVTPDSGVARPRSSRGQVIPVGPRIQEVTENQHRIQSPLHWHPCYGAGYCSLDGLARIDASFADGQIIWKSLPLEILIRESTGNIGEFGDRPLLKEIAALIIELRTVYVKMSQECWVYIVTRARDRHRVRHALPINPHGYPSLSPIICE